MKRALVLALVACHGSTPPAKPIATDAKLPGLIWQTAPQPFRLSQQAFAVALDVSRRRAFIYTSGLDAVDLDTGAIRAHLDTPEIGIHRIVQLGTDRWIGVGNYTDGFAAVTFDASFKTVTRVRVPHGPTPGPHSLSDAAVLPDGSVVLAGSNIPLATYDPTTWKLLTTIDPEPGWDRVAPGAAGILYATRDGDLARFDLAAKTKTIIGVGREVAGTSTGVVSSHGYTLTYTPTSGSPRRIADDIAGWSMDASRTRIAVMFPTGKLQVMTPDGKVQRTFELGPSAHLRSHDVAFDDDRIVVVSDPIVRSIDLTTGAVSPAGAPPFGTAVQVNVRPDGAVLVTGSSVTRLVDGKITRQSAPLDTQSIAWTPAGELARYATFDNSELTILSVDETKVASALRANDDYINAAWLGEGTDVGMVLTGDSWWIARSTGGKVVRVRAVKSDAYVSDIDVDSGVAAVQWGGVVSLVRLADAEILPHRIPLADCGEIGVAFLDRDAPRVAAADGGTVAVYQRETGVLLGSITLPSSVDHVQFRPNSDEVLLSGQDGVALWTIGSPEYHLVPLDDIAVAARVSKDGSRIALAFQSGTVALLDAAAIRKLAPTPGEKRETPLARECPDAKNPFEFALKREPRMDDPSIDGHDGVPLPDK